MAGSDLTSREGCEGIYTVEKTNCIVEHFFRCSGVDGQYVRHEMIDGRHNTEFVELADPEYNLIRSADLRGFTDSTLVSSVRRFSLSDLLANGRSSSVGVMSMRVLGAEQQGPFRMEAEMSGETKVIDGVQLRIGQATGTVGLRPPVGNMTSKGSLMIDAEDGVVLEGTWTVEFGGMRREVGGEPLAIVHPGESGFLSNIPKYDCGKVSMDLAAPPPRREG